MNYFSGVDHGTLDQGASLLTSNPFSSAMDSQSRIKGITCCYCYFFVVFFMACSFILFYLLSLLLVAVIYKGPKKLLILDNELRLMKYPVIPIGHWLFCPCYILECLFRFRDQRFL